VGLFQRLGAARDVSDVEDHMIHKTARQLIGNALIAKERVTRRECVRHVR
jgi:hypothetical protein